jgi:hypothetical protein
MIQAVVFAAAPDLCVETWPTRAHPIGDEEGRGRTTKKNQQKKKAPQLARVEEEDVAVRSGAAACYEAHLGP